jgi:hypothetical protein
MVVALLATAALAGCADRETAFERVSRLRGQHEVQPNSVQPRVRADGTEELVLDLLVLNKGKEQLDTLTFVVRVIGDDGGRRAEQRVSVDTSALRPGVTEQRTAVARGMTVRDGEQVEVVIEGVPAEVHLREYPEYAGTF